MQVRLTDGFNGHTAFFDDNAIAVDGDLLQLRCVEPGKEYMTAWKHKDEVAQAIEDQLPRKDFWDWLRNQEKAYDQNREKLCLVCGQPSGNWRHWPNVPGEHYVVPIYTVQSDFHSFKGTEKR